MQHDGTITVAPRLAQRRGHLRCVWCDIDLTGKGGRTAHMKIDPICRDCSRDPFLRMHSTTAASLEAAEESKESPHGPGIDL